MHIISNVALICINETMIIQLVSFLIFLFIINRLMFRPLIEEKRKRDNYIEKIKTDIADAIKDVEDITKKIHSEETQAKKEAMSLFEELRVSGEQEASKVFNSTRSKILDIKKSAESEIDQWLLEAKKSLQKEAENLSVSIMEKVLGRRLIQ